MEKADSCQSVLGKRKRGEVSKRSQYTSLKKNENVPPVLLEAKVIPEAPLRACEDVLRRRLDRRHLEVRVGCLAVFALLSCPLRCKINISTCLAGRQEAARSALCRPIYIPHPSCPRFSSPNLASRIPPQLRVNPRRKPLSACSSTRRAQMQRGCKRHRLSSSVLCNTESV